MGECDTCPICKCITARSHTNHKYHTNKHMPKRQYSITSFILLLSHPPPSPLSPSLRRFPIHHSYLLQTARPLRPPPIHPHHSSSTLPQLIFETRVLERLQFARPPYMRHDLFYSLMMRVIIIACKQINHTSNTRTHART